MASFVDWFRSHQFTNYREAKSQGFGLSLPIDDILIGANYSGDESGYRQLQSDVESYRGGNSSSSARLTTVVKKVNHEMAEALKQCLTQPGAHAWLETTSDPKVFKVVFSYTPTGEGLFSPSVTIKEAPVVFNATCSSSITKNTTIRGRNEIRALCTRSRPENQVVIVLNASEPIIGGGDLTLYGIPPVQQVTGLERIVGVWKGTSHYIDGTPAGPSPSSLMIYPVPAGLAVKMQSGTDTSFYGVLGAEYDGTTLTIIQGNPDKCENKLKLALRTEELLTGFSSPANNAQVVDPGCRHKVYNQPDNIQYIYLKQ